MKHRFKKIVKKFIMSLAALIFLMPFYVSIVYSLKSKEEIANTGLAFPKMFHLENYLEAIETSNLILAMKNSTISAVLSVLILIIASSMASYVIARSKTRFYNSLYYVYLAAIILPFQVVMLPLYVSLRNMGIINTIPGYILAFVGFQLAYDVFIFTGFIKTVPVEMEEAAYIDGAGEFRTYWQIVFPLLKPIMLTAVILNTLSVWNDFPLALIVLQKNELRTLPLAQFYFMGQYSTDLGLAFAAFTLSIIPVIVLYTLLQKHIISGITAGAVKG